MFLARTILEIYDSIIAEKQNMASLNALQPSIDSSQDLLNDLTSSSKVAVWRLWAFITAVAINVFEVFHYQHVAWIENISTQIVLVFRFWSRNFTCRRTTGKLFECLADYRITPHKPPSNPKIDT